MTRSKDCVAVGELVRRLGVPIHRVLYVIRSRGIRPVSKAGNARLFSEADAKRLASELRRIDAAKGGAA